MEDVDICDSLLVTEVFTPAGNWSSYPSHRHDEDDFPRITYLRKRIIIVSIQEMALAFSECTPTIGP
jgi:5-deoxy-D-glucuronate isomerase